MEVLDTLGFLLGRWKVSRSIEDHLNSIRGSFEGTARLTGVPFDGNPYPQTRARYEEAGEVSFGSHVGAARRSLDYHRMDDVAVMLHFSDGRPFVDLDLRTGAWQSRHLCGDDRYQIATLVMSRNVVQERWRVQGPTKDYDAVTTLTRSTEPGSRR